MLTVTFIHKVRGFVPSVRPSFAQLETWLESVLLHLDMGILLPTDMEFSLLPKSFIQSITESSAASTV